VKEDICHSGHLLSAQEQLANMRSSQHLIKIANATQRTEAASIIRRVVLKNNFGSQISHLAMHYFDVYAGKQTQLQLSAISCLVLASKFMERDDKVPSIDEMIRAATGNTILSARLIQKGISYE
jgi:Cyclin, N-terminal domain